MAYDWSHLCIIFYHHSMLYLNKYWIFTAFFSLFQVQWLMEKEAQIMIFEELKKHLRSPQEKSPSLKSSKTYSQFLQDPTGDKRCNRKAQKSANAVAKKRPRKRGLCRGPVVIFRPLLQRLIRRLKWDGLLS